jgi:outer membrane lipoprotein carrier protein
LHRCTELMLRRSVLTLLLTGTVSLPAAQTRPAADVLARQLQQRYDKVRDFSSDFVHTYRGGVLRKQASERGTMSVKKPGKMRWEYVAPEKKTFVSDGTKIYSYIPQDRQVIVSDVPADNQASTPALFLAGKGDIARDFTAAYVEPGAPGVWTLKLVPRRKEQAYDTLILALDPATLQIRSLTTTDSQGGESTFVFSKMKENQGLADKTFAFRIPRGVDVITDGSVSR